MPAKKTRPADKAVYLLSANHKVRRVSLKKISERVKKARRPSRVRAVEKAAVAPAKVASISIVAAGLFLFATLIGASRSSSPSGDAQIAAASTDTPAVLAADVASAPVIHAAPSIESRVAKPPVPPKASPAAPTVTPLRAPSSAPVEAARPVASTAAINTVTLSGCFDFDGKSAWLKDTSGIDAPRARSWRSGFLKKSAPRIALVDGPANPEAYDRRRVSVTGVVSDKEMRVSSLKPIANNCD